MTPIAPPIPKIVQIGGRTVPAELLYGQRMSDALPPRMAANCVGAIWRIAVRSGSNIERWTVAAPTGYPVGRARLPEMAQTISRNITPAASARS